MNALNYVYTEWNYKPAAFVSYGGVSGGIRAVQLTKPVLCTLKLVPILEQVMVPMVAQPLKDGVFEATEPHLGSAGSEEHTSELQSRMRISYAVFCLKKKQP